MGQAFGCIQVDESTVAVKEICGKYKDVLEPGCHCLPWCLGHQVAGKVSLRVQQLDVRCEAKTQDNTFVNVVASIQYRVMAGKDKAYDAFYKLTNAKGQIQAYVSDVIRASLRTIDLNSDFEKKNDIAKAVEDKLKEAMSAYGYEIVQTLIVEFEKRDKPDTNAAARKRTAENKKAEAEKSSQIKQAEGEAETKYLLGLGIARQCQAIVDGLRDSVLAFTENVPGTSAKDVMHMVLVLSTSTPHGPGAVRDVAAQIREGLPQGASVEHESL